MSQPFHAGGAAARPLFSLTNHSLHLIQDFFADTLDLNVDRVSSILTIIGFASGAARGTTRFLQSVSRWVQQFFTAVITVSAREDLHDQIMDWLRVHVIEPQGTRLLTARVTNSKNGKPIALPPAQPGTSPRRRRRPIEYLPAFGTTWFFHERRLFAVIRSKGSASSSNRLTLSGFDYHPGALLSESRKDDERISIMCVGRSTEPIKRLFETCRDYAAKQSESLVTVLSPRGPGSPWQTKAQKPLRRLETVHFDEHTKAELVQDIRTYLDPRTQRYYVRRGIPYRRGYLLHGPPGTGKTSLSLALASVFSLDLYVLEMSSVGSDSILEQLFTSLPPNCIVLLEDIDAVGMKRHADDGGEDDKAKKAEEVQQRLNRLGGGSLMARQAGVATAGSAGSGIGGRSLCTLSGLLNVLDGVASQEGRIVLMTSNFPDKLDEALLRPGRIDRKVHLGHIDRQGAEQMFRRMFEPDPPEDSPELPPPAPDSVADQESRLLVGTGFDADVDVNAEGQREVLERAARAFAEQIPERAITPAQLQEFLLRHHASAKTAVDEIAGWIAEQTGQEKTEATSLSAQEAEKRGELESSTSTTEKLVNGGD